MAHLILISALAQVNMADHIVSEVPVEPADDHGASKVRPPQAAHCTVVITDTVVSEAAPPEPTNLRPLSEWTSIDATQVDMITVIRTHASSCARGLVGRTEFPWVLQYEPRVDVLQHGYNARAAKYGKLARSQLVRKPRSAHKTSIPGYRVRRVRQA